MKTLKWLKENADVTTFVYIGGYQGSPKVAYKKYVWHDRQGNFGEDIHKITYKRGVELQKSKKVVDYYYSRFGASNKRLTRGLFKVLLLRGLVK